MADVWLVESPEDETGVVDELGQAEKILRARYLADRGWVEADSFIGERLTFDLKFGQWVLFFDRQPIWAYTATKIPKLCVPA